MPTVPAQETIDDVFDSRLGEKLALIEELRIHLGSEGIQCPGVLVVGAQSAGKSSVLERLTSIRFPRAQNTCTRVPTIVQLHTNPLVELATALVSRNADFSDARVCEDMESLEQAILAYSSSITESSAPIADSPIHIRYTRQKGPVMTLIDLPGITHVDVDGHDDFDIHEVTSSMVHKYVKNDNMVVLVVIPANDDFGNAEALRIAQLYDKEGKRTIGVVSKCDLVPKNSDILHKIRMSRPSDVKLALGFIAVRNKDVGEDGKDIEKMESALFATHELLKHLAEEQRGYNSLTRKIVDLQSQRVDEFIPEAKRLVQQRIKALLAERNTYGSSPTTITEKRMMLTGLLCEVQEQVGSLIRAENSPEKILNISSRSNEFCETFAKNIQNELPDTLSVEFGQELYQYVREASGYGLPNFISDSVFRRQVRRLLLDSLVQDETQKLISAVEEYMTDVYQKVVMGTEVCHKFEKLGLRVSEEISRLIEEAAENSRTATDALISSEVSQIFTLNPAYMEKIMAVDSAIVAKIRSSGEEDEQIRSCAPRGNRSVNKTLQNPSVSVGMSQIEKRFVDRWGELMNTSLNTREETTKQAVLELQISLYCYIDVMLKRLFDVIPMVVRDKLIYRVHDAFHRKVQEAFEADDLLNVVLQEKQSVQEKRRAVEHRLELMKIALKRLREL